MTHVPDDCSSLEDLPDWPEMLTVYVDVPVPRIRVAGLRGDLNLLTAPDFEQILDGQLAARPQALVIDLTELDFLGPDGVFVLVFGAYRAAMDGIGFCVAGASRRVANALQASGLIEVLDVHDTIEDALASYG
jgi:anti-sigma B factor antagonist